MSGRDYDYDHPDISPESVLSQHTADVLRRRNAREESEQAQQPEPPHQVIRKNQSKLQQAVSKSKSHAYIPMYGLQKKNGTPDAVMILCRRLTVQELAASNMLPKRADNLVGYIIDHAMKATEEPRRKYDVTSPDAFTEEDVKQIIEDKMGGMNRETAAAFFEFQAAVACASCIDEGNRIYMTEQEIAHDPERGVLVWDIPDEDIERIFDWAFKQEERAEETVMPFPRGGDASIDVPTGERYVDTAERSDSV